MDHINLESVVASSSSSAPLNLSPPVPMVRQRRSWRRSLGDITATTNNNTAQSLGKQNEGSKSTNMKNVIATTTTKEEHEKGEEGKNEVPVTVPVRRKRSRLVALKTEKKCANSSTESRVLETESVSKIKGLRKKRNGHRECAQSLMSTTAGESSVSDLTQAPSSSRNRSLSSRRTFGSDNDIKSSSRLQRKRYQKYTAVLKDKGHENSGSKPHEHEGDLHSDNEDYLGEERKEKVTKTLESLYTCSIVADDLSKKSSSNEDYVGDERKQKITKSIKSLYTSPIATSIMA